MDVLAIFERVSRVIPSRLAMIGDGPDRSRAEAFCRAHNLRDRVFFLGNVPNLEEIIGAANLFLLPSEAESFGMAALEAMASEVPVIATAAGGLPEVVVHGETGYLLPVGDIDALAERATAIPSANHPSAAPPPGPRRKFPRILRSCSSPCARTAWSRRS